MRRWYALVILALAGTLLGFPTSADAVNFPLTTVVSANPADNTPHVLDGKVLAIAEAGSKVVVGGVFTKVRNQGSTTEVARTNLFAYDRATGQIDAGFVPAVDGAVNALAVSSDGATVFVGGAFANVNGVASRGLAKLNVADGSTVTTFRAATTAAVNDIALRGSKLYVGGVFGKIRGVVRSRLAAVDATTGAVDADLDLPVTTPINGTLGVLKLDVTADGSRLVIIGNFQQVGGATKIQLAVINLATSPDSLADWHTSRYDGRCYDAFDSYVRDIDLSPDGSYFVIVTTGGGIANTMCDTAARFETFASGTAIEPTWINYTGGDTLWSTAITTAAVYVGGHQRWLNNRNGAADYKADGAVDRAGVGALDPLTGVPLNWNPGRARGVGAFALVATPNGLYIGSDTTSLGREYHARLGFFPLAGGTVNPTPRAATLPADLFVAQPNGTLDRRGFTGTSFGTPAPVGGPAIDGFDWNQVRGAFMVNGKLYTALADGTLRSWTWDGARFTGATNLNSWLNLGGVTSMAYQNGRILYTVSGDSRLYWRWFALESNLIGSEQFVADPGTAGADWGTAVGTTIASGQAYVAHTNGTLTRTDLDAASRPVPGTTVVISGRKVDGRNWNVTDLFIFSG